MNITEISVMEPTNVVAMLIVTICAMKPMTKEIW